MSLKVIRLEEHSAEWDVLLSRLAPRQRDVFFSSSWLLLWQRHGDGRALGAVYEDEDGLILYPFMLRELSSVDYLGTEFALLRRLDALRLRRTTGPASDAGGIRRRLPPGLRRVVPREQRG